MESGMRPYTGMYAMIQSLAMSCRCPPTTPLPCCFLVNVQGRCARTDGLCNVICFFFSGGCPLLDGCADL